MIFSLSLQILRFFKRLCILSSLGSIDCQTVVIHIETEIPVASASLVRFDLGEWAIESHYPNRTNCQHSKSIAIDSCYLSGSGVILDKLDTNDAE
jgi:hypothetical protein